MDMDSATSLGRLCCFEFTMQAVSNHAKSTKKMKNLQKDSKIYFFAPIYQQFWIEIL